MEAGTAVHMHLLLGALCVFMCVCANPCLGLRVCCNVWLHTPITHIHLTCSVHSFQGWGGGHLDGVGVGLDAVQHVPHQEAQGPAAGQGGRQVTEQAARREAVVDRHAVGPLWEGRAAEAKRSSCQTVFRFRPCFC